MSQALPNWSVTLRGGNNNVANVDNYYAIGMSYGAASIYDGARTSSLALSKTGGAGILGVHISPSYQNSTYKDNAPVTPLSRSCIFLLKY